MTIQRSPGGLLDLLSAKTSGYTLRELVASLQPTIDLTAILGLTTVEHVSSNNPTAAEGDSATLTVPITEWWLLYALDMGYERTATMSLFSASLRLVPSGGVDWVTLVAGDTPSLSFAMPSTGAAQVAALTFVPATPWLLPPGTTLFGRIDNLGTDATADIGINARICRLT